MVICVVGFGSQCDFQKIADVLTSDNCVVVGNLMSEDDLLEKAISEMNEEMLGCIDIADEVLVVNYEYEHINITALDILIQYAKDHNKRVTIKREFKFDKRINVCKLCGDDVYDKIFNDKTPVVRRIGIVGPVPKFNHSILDACESVVTDYSTVCKKKE